MLVHRAEGDAGDLNFDGNLLANPAAVEGDDGSWGHGAWGCLRTLLEVVTGPATPAIAALEPPEIARRGRGIGGGKVVSRGGKVGSDKRSGVRDDLVTRIVGRGEGAGVITVLLAELAAANRNVMAILYDAFHRKVSLVRPAFCWVNQASILS